MVATAIYSVAMVLWKETSFPLCRAMEGVGKGMLCCYYYYYLMVPVRPITQNLPDRLL